MSGIEKFLLSDFKLGWVVGDFSPSLLKSGQVEVGIKYFKAGDTEPSHKQIIATELTVVVSGTIRLGNQIYSQGEIVRIAPGIFADFEAISDSALVCIKYPSLPNDKVLE
jgi:quercetin dioxygenase-like cupin family protein